MKTILSAKWSLLKMLWASLVAVALFPSVAHADYFLQFDGIKGESTDKGHKDWIDINSFSWGVTNPSSITPGGGGGSGKASFSDFSWTQDLDLSFTGLLDNIANGKNIAKAVVDLQANGKDPFVYLKMTFEDVLLTSVNFSGGGDRPNVQGSFSYEKVKFEYFSQDDKGKRKKGGEFIYDLGNNALASGVALPESAVLVPEPETYAMLMAGLGLLGVIARRRQRVGTA